ncbi:MAG: MBL fold metallo-hydrolase [Eubacteriales bacterium]|nr:MBL fold metallo-hydrolase [Eubacteriales bacterium]
MGKVKLTWHGHSCFTLEENGYAIVLDPYADNYVLGFGPLKLAADEVLCSHGHNDHNAAQCVQIRPDAAEKKNPFSVTEIRSWHDDAQGTKRGDNVIRVFDDGEYRIAHMGDIGCMPTKEQKEQLKNIDVMLMPVGGFFTLEPADVYALVQELAPKMLVTMHYKGKGFGYDVIAPVETYAALCDHVIRLDKSELSLPEDAAQGTIILRPPVK